MANDQPVTRGPGALFTDLYELTMLQAYAAEEMTAPAVFELFFRQLPANRTYVMAAGLDDVLDYIEALHFTADDLAWLQRQPFSETFLHTLRDFCFTGDIYAVPEGTVVFENEPVLQVVAPLPQAQLIETFVLNQIHLQSVAATKAARVVTAAQGRNVVDFGSRRSHGVDAAFKVARVSYLAGAVGTSNVAAGRRYDIPVFGTMAHSYVQAHNDEMSAFRAFTQSFPETTLLVDTYDTLSGVQKVIDLAQELGSDFKVQAIRLDSGDLADLSRAARACLDQAGLRDVKIFASSSLDEYAIIALLEAGAPIDGFGVGTKLAVSADAPEIDFSYKLVAYDGQSRMKLSSSKVILPGRKQVFRICQDGHMAYDVIALHDESVEGEALLQPVMQGGCRLNAGRMSLARAREHARAQLETLPPALKRLHRGDVPYLVKVTATLQAATSALRHRLEGEIMS